MPSPPVAPAPPGETLSATRTAAAATAKAMASPSIALSRRLRSTPFTGRLMQQGVRAFTVYNRMLLPTEFHSVEEDYWHLCEAVQVWDVGAERQVSIQGPDACRLVQWMTPRDIARVALDQCVYLPLADEQGKLINDPIGIRLAENHWWLSIADSDVLLWAKGLAKGAGLDVDLGEPDVWPMAVQGPKAEDLMARVFGDVVRSIRFFRYQRLPYQSTTFIVARSGWSKQGGFEIYVDDVESGRRLYDELFSQGEDLDVRPGCPNLIERVESGLLSFGNDMDSSHTVIEAGLDSFIQLDADIDSLSLAALRAERDAPARRRLKGIVIDAPDGPRSIHADPFSNLSAGIDIRSQAYSPRYGRQLATAMIEQPLLNAVEHNGQCDIVLSDQSVVQATVTRLPFDFAGLGIHS